MIPRKPQITSDPGPAKSSSGEGICRDFLWGTCTKQTRCIYRHELDIEKMREILQFCHDYQNRNGCTRTNCKFIHATKEEENAFNATGQVPRVLAERHAALASASSSMSNAETIPQIAMFINESYTAQPPPAPWPPLPPPQPAAPSATAAPPPPPAVPPRHAPAPTPQPAPHPQQPPPPAPSPAHLPTSALPTSTANLVPPSFSRNSNNYHASQNYMQNQLFPANQRQPPMVPPEFNASMPPPPLPTTLKRKLDTNGSDGAGPSKTRKENPASTELGFCESCVERKRSIDSFKLQMDTLHDEEETQILQYKKKLHEYEMGREILKSLVEPDLFLLFDNLIEGVQTPRESLTNFNNNSSFVAGPSAEPMQAMFKLFQIMVGGSIRSDPVPSTSREDDAARRLNLGNYSNQSPDLINLVIETYRNSSAQERSTSLEVRNETSNNRVNGLDHLANGQSVQNTPAVEAARYDMAPGYSGAGMVNQAFRAPPDMPSYPVAGPSGFGSAGPALAPPPSAPYAMYHPAIPPPNRLYYGQNASGSNVPPNIHYNGGNRAPVPGPSQTNQPSTSTAPMRPNQSNAPNYQMGRHP